MKRTLSRPEIREAIVEKGPRNGFIVLAVEPFYVQCRGLSKRDGASCTE
jgi:hypothetical protein